MVEVESSGGPASRRRRRLEMGASPGGAAAGVDETEPLGAAGLSQDSQRSRRALRQERRRAEAVATGDRTDDGSPPRRGERPGSEPGLTPSSADRRRSGRRQRGETAAEAAGEVVRAAIDRISPRRRLADEQALLEMVPNDDELMSQRGSVTEGEIAPTRDAGPGAGGGAAAGGATIATWAEDPGTGEFYRVADRQGAADGTRPAGKRTLLDTLGFTRMSATGEESGTAQLLVVAAHSRLVLIATLRVAEGILAGMALLHALVVEQCAQWPFLLVAYLPAALGVQHTFQLLSTLATISALISHSAASERLAALEKERGQWDTLALMRDASYQKAVAAVVALLYATSLVVTLVNVRLPRHATRRSPLRMLPNARASPTGRRAPPPLALRAGGHGVALVERERVQRAGAVRERERRCVPRAIRAKLPHVARARKYVARCDHPAAAMLCAEALTCPFHPVCPCAATVTRTACCLLAWILATIFYAQPAPARGTSSSLLSAPGVVSTGEPPSLIASLVALGADNGLGVLASDRHGAIAASASAALGAGAR